MTQMTRAWSICLTLFYTLGCGDAAYRAANKVAATSHKRCDRRGLFHMKLSNTLHIVSDRIGPAAQQHTKGKHLSNQHRLSIS